MKNVRNLNKFLKTSFVFSLETEIANLLFGVV